MYTNEDLNAAVKAGILDEAAVEQFRAFVADTADTQSADEENFRLISGFNDIFVSISAFLLLISAGWVAAQVTPALGFLVAAIIAWLLSIFFVLRRRLALPAILLLMAFVTSACLCVTFMLRGMGLDSDLAIMAGSGVGALAAWAHWKAFHVPVTIAAGVSSLVAFIVTLVAQTEVGRGVLDVLICASGIATFLLAMRWDSRDTARVTRQSDVAFWLHLLAAPMIVHPIFSGLGIFEGASGIATMLAVIVMYVLLALVSIAVDRRALMVSSLVYVLVAFRELFVSYGMVSSSLAISGIVIGTVLLLLSAFWHGSRRRLLRVLPPHFTRHLPPIH